MPASIWWFTGPPATGKTTTAQHLVDYLQCQKIPHLWLDSDHLRTILTPQPTFSSQERDFFYQALAKLALLSVQSGVLVVISATAHKSSYRAYVRRYCAYFVEIYLQSSLTTRQERDPKGLYQKSIQGSLNNLPGMNIVYETTQEPELNFHTDSMTSKTIAAAVIAYGQQRQLLPL